MALNEKVAYLIVNADDYGYFGFVSRGILQAFRCGIVTATGIFANSAHFDKHVAWLADYPELDLGVHLNLTAGAPLTERMKGKLAHCGEQFPGKYAVAKAVLNGSISLEDIAQEWRAQIDRCLAQGLQLRFLNSHEHIHMLPPLFRLVQALASEYAISHVRFATPEVPRSAAPGAMIRDAAMLLMGAYDHRRRLAPAAEFIGMGMSGRLDLGYLERKLAMLKPGRIYELMCHPGLKHNGEVLDGRLLRYHDWSGELASLTDPAVREALRRNGVRLVGYRHVDIADGRLLIRDGGVSQ